MLTYSAEEKYNSQKRREIETFFDKELFIYFNSSPFSSSGDAMNQVASECQAAQAHEAKDLL